MCITAECPNPTAVGVWWRDDAAWKLYSKDCTRTILEAFLKGDPFLQLTFPTSAAHPHGASYHIDLVKMQQTNTASGHMRAIKVILPSSMHNPNSNFLRKLENTIKPAGGESMVCFQIRDSACLLVIRKGDIANWSVDGKTDAVVSPCHRWGSSQRHGSIAKSLAASMRSPMTSESLSDTNIALTSCHGNILAEGLQKEQVKGSVAAALYHAAGSELLDALHEFEQLATCCGRGENTIITQGFRLPVSHIIHTIAPKYNRGSSCCKGEVHVDNRSCGLLERTYKSALAMATANGMRYVGFPAIGCGGGGFPLGIAARVAMQGVSRSNKGGLSEIHFVVKFKEEGEFKKWVIEATKALL